MMENTPLIKGHQHPNIYFLEQAISYFKNKNFQVALGPEIESLKAGRSVLGLPAGVAFDIKVIDADSDHPKTSPDTDK